MIDALHSLWKELLGSWWVLVTIPLLVALRWLLSSRSRPLTRARDGFFSGRAWDHLLSPSQSSTASSPDGDSNPGAPVAAMVPAEFRRRWFLELVESALVALLLVFFLIRPFIVQAFYIPSPSMVETLEINDRILVNKFIYHIHSPHRGDIVVFDPPATAPTGPDNQGDDWIKRVIAVEGDRISIHDDHVYLNGQPQDENYVALLESGSDRAGDTHVSSGHYDYTFPDPQSISLSPGQNAYLYPQSGMPLEDSISLRRYDIRLTQDTAPKPGGDYLFFVHDDARDGLEAVVPKGKVFVMGDNRNDSEDSHYWGCLPDNRVLGQAFCIFWPVNRLRLFR